MAALPTRPPAGLPPLAPGWTEHKAPTGHTYYYNKETKKSTYTRPIADSHTFHSAPVPPPPPPPPPPAFTPTANLHHFNPVPAPTANFNHFNPVPAPTQEPLRWTPSSGPPQLQPWNAAPGTQQPWNPVPGHHQPNWAPPGQFPRGGHGGHRGGLPRNFPDRRPRPVEDRPKHRHDIPDCAPWVLIKTKLGRRFVWNAETNESFWKIPADVMKGVMEYDRREREKKERRERGEASDVEDNENRAQAEADDDMAQMEAELALAEEKLTSEVVEVNGEADMENDSEYEEVEVTDDEGEPSSKRTRTSDPTPNEPLDPDAPQEMGEDDIAWQLAQMEALERENEYPGDEDYESEEEGLALTEEDCKALFKELLTDLHTNPYSPWENLLENTALYDDDRYKALPTMKARKECFDEWAKERMHLLKLQKASQTHRDPKIAYLAFLHTHATPKLYWPEFRRKFKKEPELRDAKLSDKEREKLYREHVKRLALPSSQLKSDLSALLKEQPLATLNRSSTLDSLPDAVTTDIRFISLPPSQRDSLLETYLSTLPAAPASAAADAAKDAEDRKKRAERERRERALAERERRVEEDRRRQEKEVAYGKSRLREGEEEVQRAMRFGKAGLRGHWE